MTVEASTKIRAALAAAGFGRADVSVRNDSYSMGSTVRVRIKRAEVPLSQVETIASAHQRISRDESGEILGGGNMFVDISYESDALAAVTDRLREQLAAGRTRFGLFELTPSSTDSWFTDVWKDDGDGSGSHVTRLDRQHPAEGLARVLASAGMLAVLDAVVPPEPMPTIEQLALVQAMNEAAATLDPLVLEEPPPSAPAARPGRFCQGRGADAGCAPKPSRGHWRPARMAWHLCAER
jgi:hypothetical protein